MAKRATKSTGAKTGKLEKDLSVPALEVKQGDTKLYLFYMSASQLWKIISINRRSEEEDRGYQRVLSHSRVAAVADHIVDGKMIPTSVLIALDNAKFDQKSGMLTIPAGHDVGWVIDGQHRIAGAHEASSKIDIDLPVVALVNVPLEFQIEQFVTINREAKGVPTSLVYDLLSYLPGQKTATERAQERAADIANALRKDKNSVLFNRIMVMNAPRQGQISITNFVRKVISLVHPERGSLRTYLFEEQIQIIENYFTAIKKTYSDEWTQSDNIFLRTIGFGAMMNMFEEIFQITISEMQSFTVPDIQKIIAGVRNFDFDQWKSHGTGTKAEIEAAKDFRTDFMRSRTEIKKSGLKLT